MNTNIKKCLQHIIKIISLLRVKQYVKNLIIFAPLFFASDLVNVNSLIKLVIAFLGFSLVTSFIYILDDINDVKDDKLHKSKSSRPVACGAISSKQAIFIAIICLAAGGFIYNSAYVYLYVILNLLYIYVLKQFALIDIIAIALGFIIRLYIGGSVANVSLSPWIIIMTFLLSLFLAAAKRYDDLQYENSVRKCITSYNASFIESMMSILASVTIVAYILYTLSPEVITHFHSEYLYVTSLFVLVGLLRYLQITFVYKKSGSPTNIIYNDWLIKTTIILWIVSYICIIYL